MADDSPGRIRTKRTPRDFAGMLRKTASFERLVRALESDRTVSVSPVWQSAAALLLAALADEEGGDFFVISPTLDEADELAEDIELFNGRAPMSFPAVETVAEEEDEAPWEQLSQRLQVLDYLRRDQGAPDARARIVVAPVQAVAQPIPSPQGLQRDTLPLRNGQETAPSELEQWLSERGFRRLNVVAGAGEYGMRGGIVDVFSYASACPVRIEFFGDVIESIREFDPTTQVSTTPLESVNVVAAPERSAHRSKTESSVLDYLHESATVVLCEPADLEANLQLLLGGAGDRPEGSGWNGIVDRLVRCRRLCFYRTPPTDEATPQLTLPVSAADSFGPDHESAMRQIERLAERSREIYVFCNNAAERKRLLEIMAGRENPPVQRDCVLVGRLNHGFQLPEAGLTLVPNHRIFRRYRQRRRVRATGTTRPVDSFFELAPGDLVVHATHGIARYRGTEVIRDKETGRRREYLTLEFARRTRLHVPTTKIELVQKYVGAGPLAKPELSRIGSRSWEARKLRVAKACEDLASRLLAMQARRRVANGIQYPPDTEWQEEFEAEFLYEETEDQLDTLDAVKRDMESTRPMDRLICGDVGFGKTEIAVRAAFKTVLHGKQAAVLVPTTVLAQQHFSTFCERMADYPVNIEMLSRFRTQAEARTVLDGLGTGGVDILIGTHRIIQTDVQFKDLGLVVIDEEQRFGVDHKERLKRLRENVDVLTLTATPIPRTLHMALLGIRDISSLSTPPPDRLAIQTRLARYNPEGIRKAVLLEMSRQGQVYFLHNRVYNIDAMAQQIRKIVPEARVAVAHGQMRERELAHTMRAFIDREYDVLVCTTIIESGLDIPNVNTMFINNANHFGLAELHQLRGRVGRYKHRAYCYLLVPKDRPVTPEAEARLKAIREFAELGAGFQIALRDLEIRGAGNLLGSEQSGHIAVVGYEMYCRLLERAVHALKGDPVIEPLDVEIDLGLDCLLDEHYVPDQQSRMHVYRRLYRAETINEVEDVRRELVDRFGALPQTAESLIEITKLRIVCRLRGIRCVRRRKKYVELEIADEEKLGDCLSRVRTVVRVVDDQTVHVHLPNAGMSGRASLRFLLGMLADA